MSSKTDAGRKSNNAVEFNVDMDTWEQAGDWFISKKHEPYKDGEPCSHPGCSQHLSHPCEGCGRYLSRGESFCDAKAINAWNNKKDKNE